MSRKWALTALLVLFPLLMRGQSHFDLCQLTIHVRTGDDRDLRSHVQIELLSPSGTPVGTAQTNDDGTAYFQVSSGITYRAQISGRDIESTTSEFFIMGGQQSHTENLTVRRRSLSQSATAPKSSPSVSIAEINVPKKAQDEMKKGVEAFDRGDLDKARQRFQKAVSIYPRYARAYYNLAILTLKTNDPKAAADLFGKAIQTDDKYLPAYIGLSRLEVQEKRYTEAESLLAKVMLLNPGIPEAVALLAAAEYGNKEYDKALADAQRVHTMPDHERFANVHLLAGQILEMRNRNREAIAEYRAFLNEAPESSQASSVQKAVADLEAAAQ